MTDTPDYAEALRLIRKHMQPGDTVGMMFMRVAKALEPYVSSNVAATVGEPAAWRWRWNEGSDRDREWEMWTYRTEQPAPNDKMTIQPLYAIQPQANGVREATIEECAKIAENYRERAEAINRAPSRDAACVMIAHDIRALASEGKL